MHLRKNSRLVSRHNCYSHKYLGCLKENFTQPYVDLYQGIDTIVVEIVRELKTEIGGLKEEIGGLKKEVWELKGGLEKEIRQNIEMEVN